jgi:hypothetical protein
MELFPPLTSFYNAIAEDFRIGPLHISIYLALLQQWNLNGGKNPILISRADIMKHAKINARHSYNKSMNNLNDFGYIRYQPSANGYNCSKVFLLNCESEK